MHPQNTQELLTAAKEVLGKVQSPELHKLRDAVLSFENLDLDETLTRMLSMARQDGLESSTNLTLFGKIIAVIDYASKSETLKKYLNENYYTAL